MPSIKHGVWPTMITPFTESGSIDDNGIDALTDWYMEQQVDGIFTVCGSNEMFHLSLDERIALARRVVRRSGGRVPVVASGNVSGLRDGGEDEIGQIAETGVDAVVLLNSTLAPPDGPEDVWNDNMESILRRYPDVPFGFYENPSPNAPEFTLNRLHSIASTGRFHFFKDTCCDLDTLENRAAAIQGTPLQLFNANSATLLESLKLGAAGFCGQMANFHPGLYVWLTRNWRKAPAKAAHLQNFLGVSSQILRQYYPVNAKYYLQLEGLDVTLHSRTKDPGGFGSALRLETEQLRAMSEAYLQSHRL